MLLFLSKIISEKTLIINKLLIILRKEKIHRENNSNNYDGTTQLVLPKGQKS